MQAVEVDKQIKTTLRHGKLDLFLEWLNRHGFTPEVSEASQQYLNELKAEDRFYGELSKGDRILFIETPPNHGEIPKNYYHIVI
jgi:hypothetical protein